jgi:hypothetical protein
MLLGPRFPPTVSDTQAMALAREGAVLGGVFEPQIVPELRLVIERALEREPSRRYPHAGALAYELRHIALAMGVGDGRAFLRHALPRAFASDDDERTGELDSTARVRTPTPSSADVDRFARLRGEVESGTFELADAGDDEDEEGALD